MSEFGKLKLIELRDELRIRCARTSGRKQELVERLEAYERNFNFGNEATKEEDQAVMQVPDSSTYCDVDAASTIPCISFDNIRTYLERFLVPHIPDSAIQMYYNNYLTIVCRSSCVESGTYLRSICKAEMKKNVSYNVDILLSDTSEILECQCECAAGKGPKAHCKHVVVTLLGISEFSRNKVIRKQKSKTEVLQSFNRPLREYSGAPIPACELPLKRFKPDGTETSHRNKNFVFDPRPTYYRKMPGYKDTFRNVCLNFAYKQPHFPMLQLYLPANMYGVENDHDYLDVSLSDNILRQMKIEGGLVSTCHIAAVEAGTRRQSECEMWHEERKCRLTASNFGIICKSTDRRDKQKLAKHLMNPPKITTPPVLHGKQFEKVAISRYEDIMSRQVSKCGLMIFPEKPYLAASLDGIAYLGDGERFVLEVKCPYTVRNDVVNPFTVPFLQYEDAELKLKKNHDYYYQLQGQMLITDCHYSELLVYTFKDFAIIPVHRDDKFVMSMIKSLDCFYLEYFKDALKERYFYLSRV